MPKESNLTVEFLTELNSFLSQADGENDLADLAGPLKNYFQNQKELTSFTLCRYCGGEVRTAFFCELLAQTVALTKNSSPLFEENQNFWRRRVPTVLRGLPNLYSLVDQDIAESFLPQQINLLQIETQNLLRALASEMKYLQRYLQPNLFKKLMQSEVFSRQNLYREKMANSQYLDYQNQGQSYLQVALPCLLGLRFFFYQPQNPANPEQIPWVVLEEIFSNIATLHQTQNPETLPTFLYLNNLSDQEKFKWWQLSPAARLNKLNTDEELLANLSAIRQKSYQRTKESIAGASFLLDQHRTLIYSLLEWAFVAEGSL